jgi:hypothetical protein
MPLRTLIMNAYQLQSSQQDTNSAQGAVRPGFRRRTIRAREFADSLRRSIPPDDNGTVMVSFRDLPAHTFGDDREDALGRHSAGTPAGPVRAG